MGKQIILIATVKDIRDIIDEAKKRYDDLFIYSEDIVKLPECIPPQYSVVYVKTESTRNADINNISESDFDTIQLVSSYMNDNGFYEYGRIYIMTSQLVTTGDGYFFEKQNQKLLKVYNSLVTIVKKMCVRKYGDRYRIYYALPEGDKIFYPIHEMCEAPIYLHDSDNGK